MAPKTESWWIRIGQSRKIQIGILAFLIGGLIILYSSLKAFGAFNAPIFKWENAAFQIRSYFVKPPEELKNITIVEVDDETLWRVRQPWSFSRSIHAEFLDKLAEYKPEYITFHFMFPGKTKAEEDQALAQSIKNAGNVILATRMTVAGDYLVSEPEIQNAAYSSGLISKPRESDDSLRKTYTYFSTAEQPVSAVTSELKSFLLDQRMSEKNLTPEKNRLLIQEPGGKSTQIPLQKFGTTDINFKVNSNNFQKVPYWQILNGTANPALLQGKIVLVGITSRILLDVYETPLGVQPGVYVNAHNLLMTLTRDYLHRIPEPVQFLVLVLIGALAGWIGFKHSFFKALGGAVGVLLIFTTISAVLFWNDWMWDFFGPMLICVVSFMVSNSARTGVLFIENLAIRHDAVTDPLTKLYTRRFLEATVAQAITRAKKDKKANVSVLLTDIDHFKSVNDNFGHDMGDRVLVDVADAFRKTARKGDVLTRYGGEEFCIVLPGVNKNEAVKIAERYREAIGNSVQIEKDGKIVRKITISVGVSSAKEDDLMDFLPLVKGADLALYHSKEGGRNRVTAYESDFKNGEKENGQGAKAEKPKADDQKAA